jgi:hypothetical protein
LQENIIEEAGKRNSFGFTVLFGKEFSLKLKEIKRSLFEELEKHKEWYLDLKKYRDPAAHRIPLAFVQGVVAESESEKLKKLIFDWESMNKEFSEGNFSKLDEALKNQNDFAKLGSFLPIIITSQGSRYEFNSAPRQIDKDHKEFLSIVEIIANKH